MVSQANIKPLLFCIGGSMLTACLTEKKEDSIILSQATAQITEPVKVVQKEKLVGNWKFTGNHFKFMKTDVDSERVIEIRYKRQLSEDNFYGLEIQDSNKYERTYVHWKKTLRCGVMDKGERYYWRFCDFDAGTRKLYEIREKIPSATEQDLKPPLIDKGKCGKVIVTGEWKWKEDTLFFSNGFGYGHRGKVIELNDSVLTMLAPLGDKINISEEY